MIIKTKKATVAIILNKNDNECVLLNMPKKLVLIPVPNCNAATKKPETNTAFLLNSLVAQLTELGNILDMHSPASPITKIFEKVLL